MIFNETKPKKSWGGTVQAIKQQTALCKVLKLERWEK